MSRVRVGLGLVAVAAGTAWAVGGVGSVAASARRLADLLPLLLVLGGALVILLVIVPRGTFAGPALLVSVGLLGLAAEDGLLRKLYLAHIPALILVGTGVIVAMSRSEKIHVDTGVRRFTAFLFPVHRTLRGEAPVKIIARALFGLLKMDMSHTDPSRQTDRVWVDVTCIAGRIEIILPKEWEVQPGRVAFARRIRFEGALPGTDIVPAEQEGKRDKNLIVINVLGWLGFVVVQRA